MQISRAAARDLHGYVGPVPPCGLANLPPHPPVLTTDALLPGEHEERLGPRMSMHGRNAAGRTADFIYAKEILRCDDARDRSNLGNLRPARRSAPRGAE